MRRDRRIATIRTCNLLFYWLTKYIYILHLVPRCACLVAANTTCKLWRLRLIDLDNLRRLILSIWSHIGYLLRHHLKLVIGAINGERLLRRNYLILDVIECNCTAIILLL